jgi:Beta-propeller repeat/Viral BACON domain
MKRYIYLTISLLLVSIFILASGTGEENNPYSTQLNVPIVTWNTFHGSSEDEWVGSIAVDGNGNTYITGASEATWGSPVNGFAGIEDAYVAKIDRNGQLVWNTFLGSASDYDFGYGIAVDSNGNVYIAGESYATWSTPVNNHAGGDDAFVAKLNSNGVLQWHTFMGSPNNDTSFSIVVDNSGNLYISGISTDQWGAPVNNHAGDDDAFAAKLNNSGVLQWNTFMGCPCNDTGFDIAIANNGDLYIVGGSESQWGTPVNNHAGFYDAFVTKLDNDGILLWNTFMGSWDDDMAWSIDIDSNNNTYISGESFDTWGGPVNNFTGDSDAFVVKLNSSGTLQWNTFLGSTDDDSGYSVALDNGGFVYVAGRSKAGWGSPVSPYVGNRDAYVAQLDNNGALLKHAFLGSLLQDWGGAIAVDANRNVYFAGDSEASWGSPVNPFNGLYELDTFLAKMTFSSVSISGNTGIGGAILSYNDNGNKSFTADGLGNYSFDVSYNWSGTVTPSLAGYLFSPSSRSYSNVTGSLANQDYTIISNSPVISGTLWNRDGQGVAGATLTFSNNGGSATTDENGYYSHMVALNWSGTVTPNKTGFQFTPNQRSYSNVVSHQSNDDYIAVGIGNSPEISLNRSQLNFAKVVSGASAQTGSQTLLINNTGGGILEWSAVASTDWIKLDVTGGSWNGIVSVSVDTSGLEPGTYTGTITVSDAGASNTPQSVSVSLKVQQHSSKPFGIFATPVEGATVRSSVPFTGWVLDDIDIQSVQLFGLQNGSQYYIGDAVIVDGARPDVELAYSTYPNHFQAGWGYMMLTHFLPGGSDGTYTIIAKATDIEGNTVTLGQRTITVDNASAVKPFGAIDTPSQGGIASGTDFINWGWALTPLPNSIPTDGSTIQVWIDGVKLGNPTYNIFRQDIADLFPGYQNSNGAVGYFSIDTTSYLNGVHTIQWSVTDSADNTDGIGSRYFTIQNDGAVSRGKRHAQAPMANIDYNTLPVYRAKPVSVLINQHSNSVNIDTISPNKRGLISVQANELDTISINMGKGRTGKIQAGYLLVGKQLKALPIGSSLIPAENTLHWQLGPGFVGKYTFLLLIREKNNRLSKQEVSVTILPKHSLKPFYVPLS